MPSPDEVGDGALVARPKDHEVVMDAVGHLGPGANQLVTVVGQELQGLEGLRPPG